MTALSLFCSFPFGLPRSVNVMFEKHSAESLSSKCIQGYCAVIRCCRKKTHHIAYLPKPSLSLCSDFSSSRGMIQGQLHCFTMFPLTTYMFIYDIFIDINRYDYTC